MQGEAPLRQQEYDYIVVGSGAGGGPVAANLARRGFTVALLEAGGADVTGVQIDDAIGSTWGYTKGMTVRSAESVIRELIEAASTGGNLLLNISPKGDGSIPEEQQRPLLEIGDWLRIHGEGIYGTRAWMRFGEVPTPPVEAPETGRVVQPISRDRRLPGRRHLLPAWPIFASWQAPMHYTSSATSAR